MRLRQPPFLLNHHTLLSYHLRIEMHLYLCPVDKFATSLLAAAP